jgi:hypothetical protein
MDGWATERSSGQVRERERESKSKADKDTSEGHRRNPVEAPS